MQNDLSVKITFEHSSDEGGEDNWMLEIEVRNGPTTGQFYVYNPAASARRLREVFSLDKIPKPIELGIDEAAVYIEAKMVDGRKMIILACHFMDDNPAGTVITLPAEILAGPFKAALKNAVSRGYKG